jgi:DNA-binding protein HU-beta
MNKRQIIQAIDTRGLTNAQAEALVTDFLNEMMQGLAAGASIQLRGIGTFSLTERAERTARNPRTGAPVHVPAWREITFKQSSDWEQLIFVNHKTHKQNGKHREASKDRPASF